MYISTIHLLKSLFVFVNLKIKHFLFSSYKTTTTKKKEQKTNTVVSI